MLNRLNELDTHLLLLFNDKWTNPILDVLMPFVTNPKNFILPGIILIILYLKNNKLKTIDLIITLAFTILLSDQCSSHFLKPLIERIRPCHVIFEVRQILRHCNSSFSMPSSHATNISAFAVVMLSFNRPILGKLAIIIFAILVAFSRIYLGVHYPFDVSAGIILGSSIGIFVLFLRRKLMLLIQLKKGGLKQQWIAR